MTASKTGFFKNKLISGVRNQIQLLIFLVTIAAGFQFYLYVSQITGDGPVTILRPTGVEGFLPIGALMGWKYFLATGIWDNIHPASMVFLGFAVLVSFLLRRSFCSWFCPVGTLSEWAWKTGESFLGKNIRLPVWLDTPLRGVKYALLGFFAWIILGMSPSDMAGFFESPYYKIADIKMLYFFTKMSMITAVALVVLTILSFFIKNFWCRYACPYGAMVGIFSMVSPARITRNADSCIHCGKCAQICPSHLPVDVKAQILTPECTGCMDCVQICPSGNTLELKFRFWEKPVTTPQVGAGILVLFCVLIYMAGITGHWKSRLTDQELRMWLKMNDISMIQHPSVE
jgi:polyferredoxin